MGKAKQENTEDVDRSLQHSLSNWMAEILLPGSMAIGIGIRGIGNWQHFKIFCRPISRALNVLLHSLNADSFILRATSFYGTEMCGG